MAATTHRDLLVWQEAMILAEAVYKATANFPKEENFVLTSQLRRAAISVPSNIAEGAARNSSRELAQLISIASGSLAELGTQVELAARLHYLESNEHLLAQVDRVGRLLSGLRKSVRGKAAMQH